MIHLIAETLVDLSRYLRLLRERGAPAGQRRAALAGDYHEHHGQGGTGHADAPRRGRAG